MIRVYNNHYNQHENELLTQGLNYIKESMKCKNLCGGCNNKDLCRDLERVIKYMKSCQNNQDDV